MGTEETIKLTGFEPFYKLKSAELLHEGALRFYISILPNHSVFKGHFPGFPVVPGVMMIQTIRDVLRNYFNQKITLKTARDIKFVSLITPTDSEDLQIDIEFRRNSEELIATTTIKSGTKLCMKMDSTYVAE